MRRSHIRTMLGVLVGVILLVPVTATGQVPAQDATFSAWTTGSAVHAELVEQPTLADPTSTRAVDAEVAFSGAAVDTSGLAAQRTTEFGGLLHGELAAANAYGRGYGMDAAIGEPGATDEPPVRLAGLVEAVAPPTSDPERSQIGPVPAEPLAYASTLAGDAFATAEYCPTLGGDISSGLGYVEDAQVLDQDGAADGDDGDELEQPVLATSATAPGRAVSSSFSHTFLTAQTDAEGTRVGQALAVASETRQTIAPVTLFKGTPNELTIEVTGEWVLRAVATGIPGTAQVHYGPADASPETPVVRVIQGGVVIGQLTTQQVLGGQGLVIDALPLAEIAIGEAPHAIGDASAPPALSMSDGTAASAAVDVVRVRLLSVPGVGEAMELRVGHMEAAATAPPGGVSCDLPVDKTVDRALVLPGDTFTYTITVTNPFRCELRSVRLEDTLASDPGVTWTVTGSEPPVDESSDERLVWNDIGPIAPGASASVTFDVKVGDDSAAGFFHDVAEATALCFDQPVSGEDDEGTGIPLEGRTTLDLPEVQVPTPAAPPLPSTGGGLVALGLGSLLAGLGVAHTRRR